MSNVEARLKGYLSTICAVHYDLEMVELFETWTLKDVGKSLRKKFYNVMGFWTVMG